MKRPFLLTQKGQRFSLVIGFLASLLAAISLLVPVQTQLERSELPDLDTANVSYCLIAECGVIEPLGLEIRTVEIEEFEYFAQITFSFVNHKRLSGSREVWLRVRTPDGTLLESAKGFIQLSDRDARLTFTFTGFREELEQGKIYLGF